MSAILLGQKPLESPFLSEELEERHKNLEKNEKDEKEEIIKGKIKTYVITKTLGKGTFGKVKLAHNIDNKKEKYACKILLKINIKDEDDKIRCKREMDILKKMHHVNVVRTYEIVSTESTYYIFMDYCAKGELFNYIVEKQHLNEEKSAFFYYQLISGIEYIHKKGVCHRDLKPENLLLTEKNKLKIIDFGLSNYFKGNLLETPCGSPCYASPEMVMGNKYDGFCIDVWSSGIILYAMLCGYLPFEEMENDEYNEFLFKNIVECNVEYPNEFITPVAKDLLSKILVKDPKKRITIEGIKLHSFYLLGELLYKQIFENKGNIDDYMLIIDDDNEEKFIDFDELKNEDINDNIMNNKCLELEEKILKNYEEEKAKKLCEDNKEFKNEKSRDNDDILANISNSNFIKKKENNINTEALNKDIIDNSSKKNNEQTYNKNVKNDKNEEILNKLNQINPDINNNGNKSENIEQEDEVNKSNENKKSQKKDLYELNEEEKKQKKQLSLQNYNNIKLPINSNEKDNKENIIGNSLNIKESKLNKDDKSKKKKCKEEYKNYNKSSNINLNSKENNLNKQYLKTEIYPSNSKNKSKKSNHQCKLLNKKLVSNSKFAFDNILKPLQNKNILKNKTPKRFLTKINLINKQHFIKSNSNSLNKRKYCSYSPGIKKFSKNETNLKIKNEKNINNYPKKNYFPLITHSNIRNSYNILSENILKNFNSKFFYNNNEVMNKKYKPNKKFLPKKNDKNKAINNNINIINNDIYFRLYENTKNKNNKGKKLLKYSMNNALNMKSYENYFSSTNGSKKKHSLIDKKKAYNDINKKNYNNIYNNNYNAIKNPKNQISKKSFSSLKGNNNLNNILTENLKPILIKSNYIQKNIEKSKSKKNKNTINKSCNKLSKSLKSKPKNKNKKTKSHNLLSHKTSDKDNNIIINLNILKPNIIFDQQKITSRKSKMSKLVLNIHNNLISPKVEKPSVDNNICSTVRNSLFNKNSKNKHNNYKNIDMKQIKKSKEINQIIKSIQEMNKTQGNNNSNNKRKRLNTEFG